jgi:hypothetical protein
MYNDLLTRLFVLCDVMCIRDVEGWGCVARQRLPGRSPFDHICDPLRAICIDLRRHMGAMPERKVVTFALDHISSDASAYR